MSNLIAIPILVLLATLFVALSICRAAARNPMPPPNRPGKDQPFEPSWKPEDDL